VHRLELAGGVLVDGQRVDQPDGVVLPQTFQLVDDLAVEVGLREPQHDERCRPGTVGATRSTCPEGRHAERRAPDGRRLARQG
jgi:hypothetical protein